MTEAKRKANKKYLTSNKGKEAKAKVTKKRKATYSTIELQKELVELINKHKGDNYSERLSSLLQSLL
jgi:hypothetical protein